MSLNQTLPLPGENGFHIRDGSLIRKKKEQWAKEKGLYICLSKRLLNKLLNFS